jgi:hypothetical protein
MENCDNCTASEEETGWALLAPLLSTAASSVALHAARSVKKPMARILLVFIRQAPQILMVVFWYQAGV